MIIFGLCMLIVLVGCFINLSRYAKHQEQKKKEYENMSWDNFDMDKFMGRKSK